MKIKVPAKALRLPGVYPGDDNEDGPTPEVNDPVSFHVEGVVTGRDGESCEVDVRFVNGERPGDTEGKKEKSEEEDLREAAEAADSEE